MKLIINEQTYEVDKQYIESMFAEAIDKFLSAKIVKPQDKVLREMVRTSVGSMIGFMAMKHQEFRKPSNVDALEFAATKLSQHVLKHFDEHGLVLKGKLLEAKTVADSKQAD